MVTLFDYTQHIRYSIYNHSRCHVAHIPPDQKIGSVFDLLRDHANLLEYDGIEMHRGIQCDVWSGRWTFWSEYSKATIREFARWYFARPNWNVFEAPHMHRRPVAAVLASNRTHSSLIGFEEHYISFIDFNNNLDHYSERQVDLEWRWHCPGGPPQPDFHHAENDDVVGSGGVAGLTIAMVLIGAGIGFGGHWYQLKKGAGRTDFQEL